jgi:hypothetical protein
MRAALWVCLLFAVPLGARTKPTTAPPADADYISALATANRFLYAWQTQDQETGILMLTDQLKQHTPEERMEAFFTGLGAQHAFEVGRGKKLGPGRYSFPVALFSPAEAPGRKRTHPAVSEVVVSRAGKNDWAIDKLP